MTLSGHFSLAWISEAVRGIEVNSHDIDLMNGPGSVITSLLGRRDPASFKRAHSGYVKGERDG